LRTARFAAEQEYDFCAQPENQDPAGPPCRRSKQLTAPITIRIPPELLDEIRKRAEADDRPMSAWSRRGGEREIARSSCLSTSA
jgi:hypothetical protein